MKNTKLFLILIPFVMLFSACKFNTISREAEYKVSHYLQNTEDEGYTLSETETLKGLTGSQTEAAPKEYEGFTALNFSQKPVSEGIEIEIKYDRNIVTCALDYNGGTVTKEGVETKSSVVSGRYGTKIVLPEPVKEGYSIENWTTSDGTVLGDTFLVSGTYSANYVKKADGQFKVTYSFQNLEDDDYSADTNYPDEVFPGMKGETTNVIPKAVKGFVPETVVQKEIAADGSTVIEVKYARKLVTLYISLNNAVGKNYIQGKACKDDEKEKSHAQVVAALNEITSSNNLPQKISFKFEKFLYEDDLAFTLENNDTTCISIKWNTCSNSYYYVKVFTEKICDEEQSEYELKDLFWVSAVPETLTSVQKNFENNIASCEGKSWSFPGYYLADFENKLINVNDTTTINVFFKRKTVNVKINPGNGNKLGIKNDLQDIDYYEGEFEISGKYGSKTPEFVSGVYGYSVDYFKNVQNNASLSLETFPTEDIIVETKWKPNVYKIIFHNSDSTTEKSATDDITFTKNYTFGSSVPGITCPYENENLAGWSINEDCSSLDYKVGATINNYDKAENLELYAVWTITLKINVSYRDDWGNGKYVNVGVGSYDVKYPYTSGLTIYETDSDFSSAVWNSLGSSVKYNLQNYWRCTRLTCSPITPDRNSANEFGVLYVP